MRLPRMLTPRTIVRAHCDLPLRAFTTQRRRGSKPNRSREFARSTRPIPTRTSALARSSSRSSGPSSSSTTCGVLWTDYFKPPHFEKYPNLHQLFNEATKLAGASGAKGSADPDVADQLLGKIEEISKIFWETKAGVNNGFYDPAGASRGRAGCGLYGGTNWPSTNARPNNAT